MTPRRLDPLTLLCLAHNMPVPTTEHRFAPPRRFRFDYAWPLSKVALEQEGGVWTGGRHTRGAGYLKDLEKYNLAVVLGWRVVRFTPQQIAEGAPVAVLQQLGVRYEVR